MVDFERKVQRDVGPFPGLDGSQIPVTTLDFDLIVSEGLVVKSSASGNGLGYVSSSGLKRVRKVFIFQCTCGRTAKR